MSLLSTVYKSEKSYRGYNFDELKSAIQKYIRRGNDEKALYFYLELESFGFPELEIEPKMNRGEGLRTNMLHRIMIIYLEDISAANFDMLYTVDKTIFEILNLRKKRSPENFDKSRKIEINCGGNLIKVMTESMHSRLLDHILTCIVNIDYLVNPNKEIIKEIKEYIKGDVENFVKAVKDKSLASFYFLKKLFYSVSPGKYYNSTKSIFYIIYLLSRFLPEKLINVAVRWAKELKTEENILIPILLISKILGLVNSDEYKINPSVLTNTIYISNNKNDKGITINYDEFLKTPRLELDDYVIDRHTKAGMKLKKTKKDWILEGSIVNNEWVGGSNFKKEYEFIHTNNGTRYNKPVKI